MRYLPLTESDRRAMLATIGVDSIEDLYKDVPEAARLPDVSIFNLPDHQSEMAVEQAFTGWAMRNLSPGCAPFFLGAGAYRHHIPASVDHLIQRGEFLTAYTPYQPEVSQGTLQLLFEFQTQVAMIAGLDAANASLYDGPSACAEAVLMACRVTKRKRAVLAGTLHPHYREVTETHAAFLGLETESAPLDPSGASTLETLTGMITDQTACVVIQTPDLFGTLHDLTALAEACHAAGALLVGVTTEVVSWGMVNPPGAMGADIVAAEGQSLGVPLSFGGPYLGLFACRDKYVRQMPGRLAGETVDVDGRRGYVLTLVAREQHIRREKATSNICTNSGLCALAFSIHLSLLGEQGFRHLAALNHARAVQTAETLSALEGVELVTERFFNEFTLRFNKPAEFVVEALAAKRILAGVPATRLLPGQKDMESLLLVAVTETVTDADIEALAAGLKEVL